MNQTARNSPKPSRLEASAAWFLPVAAIVLVSLTAAMKRRAAASRADRAGRVEAAVQAAAEDESRRLDDGAYALHRLEGRLNAIEASVARIESAVAAHNAPLDECAEKSVPPDSGEKAGSEVAAGNDRHSIRSLLGSSTNGTFRQIYTDRK